MSATEKLTLHSDELRINAIAVSRGIGVGPAVFLPVSEVSAERRELPHDAITDELDRLRFAVGRKRANLDLLAGSTSISDSVAGIFDPHLLILESFVAKVEERIRNERINSEWAIDAVLQDAVARQGNVADAHLREKQLDLKDVAAGIIDELRHADRVELPTGSVIITREVRPSAVMDIARMAPAALITRRGGWTSHSSILARELGIPMVTGVDLTAIGAGDTVIVNGFSGEIVIRPDERSLGSLKTDQTIERSTDLTSDAANETKSLDGAAVTIRVNAESSIVYENARQAGATGIGLFRSEALIPNSGKMPSEDQQTEAYLAISEAVGDEGVNIRTFDIGPEMLGGVSTAERNPALGLRSIRLSLAEPELLKAQLRAILRANRRGNISVVIPMVSGLNEIIRLRETIHEITDGSTPIPRIGAMIEVPSAVLTAREIADEVDFLCLGTNDLVQYLLAVDRDNERVADWYQTLNPAVLRAIREVVNAGREAAIPVTVCGEMAGSLFYIPLLIGLGVRNLSMSANSIAAARGLIAGISTADAESIAYQVSTGRTAAEVDSALRGLYLQHWGRLFPQGFLDLKHS